MFTALPPSVAHRAHEGRLQVFPNFGSSSGDSLPRILYGLNLQGSIVVRFNGAPCAFVDNGDGTLTVAVTPAIAPGFYEFAVTMASGYIKTAPYEVADIAFWRKAGYGETVNNGRITAGVDISGNANNFAQPTGSLQPYYRSSDASWNNAPSHYFLAANNFLSTIATVNLTSAYTVFTTLCMDDPLQHPSIPSLWDSGIWLTNSSAVPGNLTNQTGHGAFIRPYGSINICSGGYNAWHKESTYPVVTSLTKYIWTLQYSNSSAGVRKNGVDVSWIIDTGSPALNPSPYYIHIGYGLSHPNYRVNGSSPETIVVRGNVGDRLKQKIEAYLGSLYNVTLPFSLPTNYIPNAVSISPNFGHTGGDTLQHVITGSNLRGATSVTINGMACTFTDNGDDTLTITQTPALAAGTLYNVSVVCHGITTTLVQAYETFPFIQLDVVPYGMVLSGSAVTNWNSQAATVDGLVSEVALYQPVYTASDANWNNKPSIYYATNKRVHGSIANVGLYTALHNGTGSTIVVAFRPHTMTFGVEYALYDNTGWGANHGVLGYIEGGVNGYLVMETIGARGQSANGSIVAGNKYIASWRYSESVSPKIAMDVNGTAVSTITVTNVYADAPTWELNVGTPAGRHTNGTDGEIQAFLAIGARLSDTQLSKIKTWLNSLWSVY